jgi:cellulose biosynthesis protein BcsQ
VTVIGAAGGVGTTTVAATLARIASRRGRNVFLLDGADESIVPLYLGAGRVVSGVSASWSYFPHPGSRQGVISVITCGEPVGGQNDQSPWNRARTLGGAADDVIVDSGCHRYLDCSAETIHSTATLVVLAPDIRSVLQVRHIERKFAGRDEGSLPRYVLNQFVSELPQHQEVRASLSDHLGGRLAPTTVRSAPEISQALAQGLTVIDFAPDSPVARDLVQVAEWLRNSARSAIHTRQSATAAGL